MHFKMGMMQIWISYALETLPYEIQICMTPILICSTSTPSCRFWYPS